MRLLISKQNQHTFLPPTTATTTTTTTSHDSEGVTLPSSPSSLLSLWNRAQEKATKIQLIKVEIGHPEATILVDKFLSHPSCQARIWESIHVEYCTGEGLPRVLEAMFTLKTLELIWKEEDNDEDLEERVGHRNPLNLRPFQYVSDAPSAKLALQSDMLWSDAVNNTNINNMCKAQWLQDTLVQGKDSIRTLDLSGCSYHSTLPQQQQQGPPQETDQQEQPQQTAVQSIAKGLSTMTNLHVLKLSNCNLRDADLAILVEGLHQQQKQQSSLKELYLSENNCGPDCLTALAELMRSPSCTLTRLDLSQSLVSSSESSTILRSSIAPLADALQCNTSLTFLNLASNRLNNGDFIHLVTALQHNTTLETLYFHDNCMTDQAIATFIASSTSTPCLSSSSSSSSSSSLCSKLPSSLRILWLHGNPGLTIQAVRDIHHAMQHQSMELYEVLLPQPISPTLSSKEEKQEWLNLQQDMHYLGDLNRAGRRILRAQDHFHRNHQYDKKNKIFATSSSSSSSWNGIPPSLWPLVMARINRLQQERHDAGQSMTTLSLMDTPARRRLEGFSANAIFYLLQGPVLLER